MRMRDHVVGGTLRFRVRNRGSVTGRLQLVREPERGNGALGQTKHSCE